MSRLAPPALTLLSLPLVAACAGGPLLRGDGVDLVRGAIDHAWRQHIAAAIAQDLDGMMGLYTEDCVYVVDSSKPVVGHTALQAMERHGLDAGRVLRVLHRTDALRVDGDLAYELGTVDGNIAPTGREPQRVVFYYAAVWRLGDDASWRIGHLVGQVEAVLEN